MTKEEIINKIQELSNMLDNAETIQESLALTRSIQFYERKLDECDE